MQAVICERWDLPLTPPTDGDRWFLDWAVESPKGVSGHLTSSWHAYSSLTSLYAPHEINSAREYFGGIGAQSLMIHELFHPADHVVMDYSPAAVEHLRRTVPFPVHARRGDAYSKSSVFSADLVGFDCGDMTVWRLREGKPHRAALDRIFDREPKAVVLTDIAGPYLHLHRQRYETLLGPGTCATYETYLNALASWLEALYGYRLVAGFNHRWSTVMALVPDDRLAAPGLIYATPADPVGLVLHGG